MYNWRESKDGTRAISLIEKPHTYARFVRVNPGWLYIGSISGGFYNCPHAVWWIACGSVWQPHKRLIEKPAPRPAGRC